MNSTQQSRQQGFLLVTVVVILAVLASVAMLLSNSASMDNAVLARHAEVAELDYVAEAGMAHAKWQLAQNTSCTNHASLPATPFGTHSYTASFTPTSGSPVSVTAQGTLINGAQRTLQSRLIEAYQPSTTLMLQPDAAAGKDTRVYQWKSAWNYGTSTTLSVENRIVGDWSNALLEFDVNSIPAAAKIISATLVLNQSSPAASGGDFSIKRITSPWVEGAMSGTNGSPNWNDRDTGVAWATPGGDYDPTPIATINISAGLLPHQWEVGALVQSWVSGVSNNYGLAIVPASFGSDAIFHSSDAANAALRPSLEVTYACECGIGEGSGSTTLQPGAEGKDTLLINGSKASDNTGLGKQLWISNNGVYHHGLIEFDLSTLPAGATASSATLEIYDSGPDGVTAGTAIGIHRITQDWVEGTGVQTGTSPADGASWNTTDGVDVWATPGGDYDPVAIDTSPVPDVSARWHQFDATTLVAGWLSGDYPNNGLLIRAISGSLTKSHIESSDHVTQSERPKLTIDFNCPCGTTCTVSSGSNPGAGTKLLFVVGDPSNLTTQQQNKKALIEGWGYSVTMIATSESQAAFDTAAADVDVVYIPELGTTPMNELGNKANGLATGVITEEARRAIQLGGFALSPFVDADSINIIDNTHFITETLPVGSVLLSTAVQSMWVLKPTLAPDLHVLGQLNGTEPGLAFVDIGEQLNDGSSAPGRRVKLPWGAYDFDVSLFTDDAKTLMQRAIQWASAAGVAPKKVLFVVGRVGGPGMTTEEVEHQALLESWGYIIQVIDDGAPQTDFDAAVATNDVVFMTNDITASNIGTKLINASIGVVTSEGNLSDEFGMASAVAWESGTVMEINDNSHYVTAPFTTGLLTVLSNNESLAYVTGTLSTDLSKLASSSSGFGIVALANGASMYGGGSSAGRRIQLPWGGNGFSPSSLNGDGLMILQRALEWGASAGDTASLAPIAHWKLDDGAGLTALDSEGGHDGTLTTGGPVWVAGTIGDALNFDGANDHVDLTSDAELDDVFVGGATVMAWIEPAGWGNNGYGRIFDKSSSPSATGNGWVLRMNVDNGGLNFGQGFTSGRGWWRFAESSLSLGSWQHIAVAYDASSTANDPVVYLNGSPVAVTRVDTPSGDVLSDAAINLHLGNHASSAATFFDGKIDDARVYDRMLNAAEIADIAAGGGGGGGGSGLYVETYQEWTPTEGSQWQVQDLSGFGVPPDAVVEVAVTNGNPNFERWVGLRAVGSVIDRRLQLTEAEADGEDVVVMHVQANSSSQIEHYAQTADLELRFVLLGYWTAGTYVERFDVFTAGTSTSWVNRNLAPYGVGPGSVAEIVMTNNNPSLEREAGVRTPGSGLNNRRVDLQEAENGGVDGATMMVVADGSANAAIQVAAEADADVDFHLVGYWSTPPGTYIEAAGPIFDPSSANSEWTVGDFSGSGAPANSTVQIAIMNGSGGREANLGVRAVGSSLERWLDLREAEAGGRDIAVWHVNFDGSSAIEFYDERTSEAHEFRVLGWWQ